MGGFRLIGGSLRLVFGVDDLAGEGRGLARMALMLVGASGRLFGLLESIVCDSGNIC